MTKTSKNVNKTLMVHMFTDKNGEFNFEITTVVGDKEESFSGGNCVGDLPNEIEPALSSIGIDVNE